MGQGLNITKNPSAEAWGSWSLGELKPGGAEAWGSESLEDSKEGTVQFLRLGNLAESNNCATPKKIKVLLFMII